MKTIMDTIHQELANLLKDAGVSVDPGQFVTPPNPKMGDLSFGCFHIAKSKNKTPNQVAAELYKKLQKSIVASRLIKNVAVAGPYINFFFNAGEIAKLTLPVIEDSGDLFGWNKDEKQTVLFEYSQPNTHKAFHIGHLRNAVLGWSLINLYRSQGMVVKGVTYINDVGTHVAQCLWSLKKFFASDIPKNDRGRFLGTVYAHGGKMLEKRPEWKEQVQDTLRRLEAKEPEVIEKWKETRKWSLKGFESIYKTLSISFDDSYFESDVREDGQRIVDKLIKSGVAIESQGAIIVDLKEFGLDVLVLRKTDGTGLYSTSDLGLAKHKSRKKWDESVVLTDVRQALYFKQLMKTLELSGSKRSMRHIGYEFVTLKDGSMASRKGNVVLFEDFYDEVLEQAIKETKKRHEDWSEKRVVSIGEGVSLAAIKFSMLKVNPGQVITFDPKEALSLTGFSGPSILYTNARIESILKKVKSNKNTNSLIFSQTEETKLLMLLAQYPESLKRARSEEDPSEICKYVYELSKLFSQFYENCPILQAEESIQNSRMRLIKATKQVLESGLKILGIDILKEM